MAKGKRFQVRSVFRKGGRTFSREVASYSTRRAADDVAREERQFPSLPEVKNARRVAVVVVDTENLENPSRGVNMALGGGLGVLLGGVLLGLPGALVGGGIGAVLGSERGDTRRALDNPRGRKKDA